MAFFQVCLQFWNISAREGQMTCYKLEVETTDRPNVSFMSVRLTLEDFGRHQEWGPATSLGRLLIDLQLFSETQICDFTSHGLIVVFKIEVLDKFFQIALVVWLTIKIVEVANNIWQF